MRELLNGCSTTGLVECDKCDVSLSRLCLSPKGFQVFAAEAGQHNIKFLRGRRGIFDGRFVGSYDLSGFDTEPILEGFDVDVTMAPTDVPLGLVVRTIEQHVQPRPLHERLGVRVVERLNRDVAAADPVGPACFPHEQAVDMFIERKPEHRAHQVHACTLEGSFVERVAEDHGMSGLFRHVRAFRIGLDEEYRDAAVAESVGEWQCESTRAENGHSVSPW